MPCTNVFTCSFTSLCIKTIVTLSVLILTLQIFFGTLLPYHSIHLKSDSTSSSPSTTTPNVKSHGASKCLPPIPPSLIAQSHALRQSCTTHSPFDLNSIPGQQNPRIAVVTAQFTESPHHADHTSNATTLNTTRPLTAYQLALQSHILHALIHGHQVHVLCDPLIDALWNKQAFLLSILLSELQKPAQERLDWVMWVDRDTLILDQCRPISSFLPPSPYPPSPYPPPSTSTPASSNLQSQDADDNPDFNAKRKVVEQEEEGETNILISNDPNGLNDGTFLLRIHPSTLLLLTATLSFAHFRPTTPLPYTEQSALSLLLSEAPLNSSVRYVPQHWFNSYPYGTAGDFARRENARRGEENGFEGDEMDGMDEKGARRGYFLVHFAGADEREEMMGEWVDMLREEGNVWERGRVQRYVSEAEVRRFWKVSWY